ncbi:glycosyltransferase family 2 protein [Dokdonella soli]|uniref:Glycosyltransferase family 2 protein n=1 Tax=Dokdonella soli TaxID=529810 RepID=A0ABN1II35_9GAMM
MDAPTVQGLTSIVVVAADSGPLLRTCIESALASDAPVEVVLVDNASGDGEVERVQAAHAGEARLRVLRNDSNLGFGPACNRGAALARGDVLVILNPDCELRPDSVARLRGSLDAAPDLGLLGVTVCDANGTPARGNRRRDPTLRRVLASMTGLARLESRWPAFAGVEMPAFSGAPIAIETVEAVSGACMTLPRHVFDRVGGFDEGYFLHVEDLDLCRRVRDAGFRVAIAHEVRVIHAQGSSSRHRPWFVARHKHRGMWRYFLKFDPAARNPLLRALVWSGLGAHFALKAPLIVLRGLISRA